MIAIHAPTTMSEFFCDFVIYRRLEPADERLPGLPELWPGLGWPAYRIPRKSEPDYARVVVEMLRCARRLEATGSELRRLIYIGDTRMNDGTAFANLCEAGGWEGQAFICAEKPSELPDVSVEERLCLANRWSALGDFLTHVQQTGIPLDAGTVAVVDMDKTTVGARGRNDKVIDNARVQAVHETVAGLLGDHFDAGAFRHAYDTLNEPAYHTFTGDNQDILAYLCLVISGGLVALEDLIAGFQSRQIASFDTFIRSMDDQRNALEAAGLLPIHRDVRNAWETGDPTPFKAFRYCEYETTARLFDPSPAEGPAETLLQERILITEEVRSAALHLKQCGVLVFGLSDKPDEASVPSEQQRSEGWQPLHRLQTHSAGERLTL